MSSAKQRVILARQQQIADLETQLQTATEDQKPELQRWIRINKQIVENLQPNDCVTDHEHC